MRGEVSPEAVARFDGASLDEDAALAAYDDAADGGRRRLRAPGRQGVGRRRRGADRQRRPGPRQGAALARCRKHLRSGEDLLASVAPAVEQFVDVFTQMGGLMAERVTDLRDIGAVSSPTWSASPSRASRCPTARRSWSPRTSRRPTPPTLDPAVVLALVTERGGPTSHTAIIARQLGIPCVVGRPA